MPNRRDVKGANGQWGNDSLLYSDDPLWNATTQIQTDSRVDATFEAMGQGSKQKVPPSNITEPVNVIPVNTSVGQLPYVPLTPRSPSDSADGYNKKPNLGRVLNYGDDNSAQTDTGNVWSPSYHALGLAIYGIQRSTIPSWAKVITIARTQPAGRVIAQGIATYDFEEAGQNPSFYQVANKFTNRWIWWGRDVQSAFVLESTWDDVINNPQNYSLQAVAPLGFYNETYGWWRVGGQTSPNARAFDMLLYAGVQRDNGQVNVGESNVGITPILPNVPQGNYVTFGQYRNTFNPNSYWVEGSNDGNSLISLADNGVQVFDVSQRGRAIRFLMDNNVYLNQSTGDARNFGDAGVRNFHEPFYVVNVVRDAAEVPEQNNQQYIATEYIKVADDARLGREVAQRTHVQHRRVDPAGEDQPHLQHEHRLHDELGGVRREHRESAERSNQEAQQRPRYRVARQQRDRHAPAQAEQPQVDQRDRAEQQREAPDVDRLGDRVGVQRLAHEPAEAGRLDRVQRARHGPDALPQLDGLAGHGDAVLQLHAGHVHGGC
jgi:hypothetical protein